VWEVVADPPESRKYGDDLWKHGWTWDFPPRSEDDSEDDHDEDLEFELSSTSLALAADRAALDAARAKYTERESRLAAFAAGTVTFNRLKVADPNGSGEICIYEAKGELLNGRPQYVPVEEEENRVHSCLHFDGSAWQTQGWGTDGYSEASITSTQGSSALIPEEVVEWESDDGHYQSYGLGVGEAGVVAILPDEVLPDEVLPDEGCDQLDKRILLLGLDAAGKTTILYKRK
jgi:hypothetical protein